MANISTTSIIVGLSTAAVLSTMAWFFLFISSDNFCVGFMGVCRIKPASPQDALVGAFGFAAVGFFVADVLFAFLALGKKASRG
jgi:hypothetical protein